ncbi:C-4 sterol methyl oxidase [Handroanthus impetiginosus]|uniref:C-4 sterol methyl oxidase n=1 Tax=Handroanthus impetiginosus TaxID=429701 RepID=A0A2G9I4H6_9LAMI|nr:C-4 sterol methyl oxidase [Handroanthus impetiginosus]
MLPYETLEDATVSLGRNLTLAEILWFQYSARKSDYILFCHNALFFFILYTIFPLPYMILELMRSEKIDKYKLQPNVKNSLADMLDGYRKFLYIFLPVVLPLQIFSCSTLKNIGIRTGLPLPSRSEIFWQLLVYFVIEDYAHYWLHRLSHHKWFYEKIHQVHHEYTAPIGFVAPYAHWAEFIIGGSATLCGPMLVPGHIITFWLYLILREMESIETHSGYDFPWSPTKYIPFYGGAVFHDYHHFVGGKTQSNFAPMFTYCDYIYGTDKGYRYMKKFEKTREKLKEK